MVNCKEIYRYTRRLDVPGMDVREKLLLLASAFSSSLRYDSLFFLRIPPNLWGIDLFDSISIRNISMYVRTYISINDARLFYYPPFLYRFSIVSIQYKSIQYFVRNIVCKPDIIPLSLSLSLSKKIKRDLYLSELAAKHFSKWTNISIVTSSLPPH